MSIEDRIAQALITRPYLDHSEILTCANRMLALNKVGQTAAFVRELNTITCPPYASGSRRFRSHVEYHYATLGEAANVGANLYSSAVIAALVTANVNESELAARGIHWAEANWANPLAVLSHIASLAITHPKVRAFDVSVSTHASSLDTPMNKEGHIKVVVELRVRRTK